MDIIKGTLVDEEIDRLIQEKKWFKLHIPSKNFERITILTARQIIGKKELIQIDTPSDLQEIVNSIQTKLEIQFEFRGSDNVRYQFASNSWHYSDNQLWISKPQSINRIQKRNNFRIQAPLNANLILKPNGANLFLRIENVSIGGVYASMLSKALDPSRRSHLVLGQQFVDIELVFPLEIMDDAIHILQAQIIRVEKNYKKNRNGYAFHFIEIDSDPKKLLTRVVYKLQRLFLKRRIK